MGLKNAVRPLYHRFIILVAICMIATGFPHLATQTGSAAAPPPIPAGRDITIPYDPPVTIQKGNQAVQASAIRRIITADGREAVADRIIVGFRDGVSDAEKDAVYQTMASKQVAIGSGPPVATSINPASAPPSRSGPTILGAPAGPEPPSRGPGEPMGASPGPTPASVPTHR